MELLTPKDQPFKTELYKVRIYGVFHANSLATLKKNFVNFKGWGLIA